MFEEPLQQHIRRFLGAVQPERASNNDGLIALGTSVGLVRTENQDCALVMRVEPGSPDARSFLVAALCDGLGGMSQGGEAASLALSVFASRLIRTARLPAYDRLEKAAEDANWAVHDWLNGRGGTTLSAVLIDEDQIFALNAGDSRVYQVNYPKHIEQLSRDDNLAAYADGPGADKAQLSSRLLQFVGMGEGVEFHMRSLSRPSKEAGFLLTSDGVHGVDRDVFSLVACGANPGREVVRRLVTLAEWCGGKDNATAVFVPAVLTDIDRPRSPGILSLRLYSTSRSLEFLIPTRSALLEPERQFIEAPAKEFLPELQRKARAANNTPKPERGPERSQRKKKAKSKSRAKSGENSPPEEEMLPRLEVDYPEKSSR